MCNVTCLKIDEVKTPRKGSMSEVDNAESKLSYVTVDKVCASTSQFEWRYARFSWPHLPGKGTAVVRVSGLRASIGYQLKKAMSNNDADSIAEELQVCIEDVVVHIDDLQVDVSPSDRAKRARTKKASIDDNCID